MNFMRKTLLIFLLFTILLVSCKTDSKPLLPEVIGKQGEVAIIINKAEWDTKVGETYRLVFSAPYEMLPQYEPVFNVFQVPYDAFNELFIRHRNVIFTQISPKYSQSRFLIERDRYARQQVFIYLQAADDSAFVSLLRSNGNKIINYLNRAERERILNLHLKNLDSRIQEKIIKKHNVSLVIPKGYKIERDSADFTWVNQEIGDVIQGIMIYHYAFHDSTDFGQKQIIAMRDKVVKKYMPGEMEGSYMTTEKMIEPLYKEYLFKGNRYVVEMRGLWKIEKGISMGGPFMSLSTHDKKNQRILTIEGFVYAAGHNKRNFMQQLETILYSMTIQN
jgi:hypothetical protein